MKIDWNRKYATVAVYAFLTVAACILLFFLAERFEVLQSAARLVIGILRPFIVGFVFAYVLLPVLNGLEKRVFPVLFREKFSRRTRRGLAIFLTVTFGVSVVALFFAIVIPQMVESIALIGVQVPDFAAKVEEWIPVVVEYFHLTDWGPQLQAWVNRLSSNLLETISAVAAFTLPRIWTVTVNVTSGLVQAVVGVIISVYIFYSKERFAADAKKLLFAFFPPEFVIRLIRLAHESHRVFSGFISGKILDSAIIGFLCFVGLSLIGTPYPVLVSVIVGITNVIPYFGPFLGAIPSALFILMISPLDCLWFLIFILVLQQLDGNVIGPMILGESTGLSAFWVIFAITFFGGLWGFVGMLVGVPLFAVIYSLIRQYTEYRLARREMPTETAAYAAEDHPLMEDQVRLSDKPFAHSGSRKSRRQKKCSRKGDSAAEEENTGACASEDENPPEESACPEAGEKPVSGEDPTEET